MPGSAKPSTSRKRSKPLASLRPRSWHPLIGARLIADRLEWSAQVDPKLVPDLADHKVDGTVLLPGSAFVEMALAVARSWLESDQATIAELDIQQPMGLCRRHVARGHVPRVG